MLRRRGRRLTAALALAVALTLAAVPAHAAGPPHLDPAPLTGLTALWDLARQWLAAALNAVPKDPLPAAPKGLVLPGGGEHGSSIDPNSATTNPNGPQGEHGSSIDPDG
jgi:hypothetical protein